MNENNPNELLTAGEAAEYLAQRWGRESYSQTAFKMLRHRWNLQPAHHAGNATLWRRSDLDKIPEPDRSKPRGRRTKETKQPQKSQNEDPGKNIDSRHLAMLSFAY